MNNWTRRSLLIGGALVALPVVGFGGGKLWCGGFLRRPPEKANLSLLGAFYPDIASAEALGRRYLSISGFTAPEALQRLQRHKWIAAAAGSGCIAKTTLAIERACRDDFTEGRFYCIDGWILARTELDVAALCTMT